MAFRLPGWRETVYPVEPAPTGACLTETRRPVENPRGIRERLARSFVAAREVPKIEWASPGSSARCCAERLPGCLPTGRRAGRCCATGRGTSTVAAVRTVFLGTTGFAAAVLERLAASAHRPVLVLTRPDRPRGRGRRPQSPPVADAARTLGIELDQPESINADEARARIAATGAESVCICAFGALLREPLLSEYELLNVHPSMLPRWRGAAPVERAIAAGDRETGVSIMRPIAELDAGPVYLALAETIAPVDDYGSLAPRLAALGGELLIEALDDPREPVSQADRGVTYAAKVERSERQLHPARSAVELERLVRALTPHIGAWVETGGGERLGVRRARVELDGREGTGARGEGLVERDGRLLLLTAEGALELLEVQPPGGRAMDAGAYLRGRVRR